MLITISYVLTQAIYINCKLDWAQHGILFHNIQCFNLLETDISNYSINNLSNLTSELMLANTFVTLKKKIN